MSMCSSVIAFPSFRMHVPNGERVQCPTGADGCKNGDVTKGQPAKWCPGLGHNSCVGGSFPLNPFGAALKAADYKWTKALCEADSDGDGLTNGDELGDPCCLWAAYDAPSQYTSDFAATHPGVANDAAEVAKYTRPTCSLTAPVTKAEKLDVFNPGEEQRVAEMLIDNYTIPSDKTTYVDFAWNFPDDSLGLFHVVMAEAIVKTPKHLHHYVVRGCPDKFSPEQHGKVIKGRRTTRDCKVDLGGWAPGKTIISTPSFVGLPIGRDAGIRAFTVQVHYDNPDHVVGAVSNDGMRIHYTPTLRNHTAGGFSTTKISASSSMIIPPKKRRFFITRTCHLSVKDQKTRKPSELHLYDMGYHAHLLGREMYTEITWANTTTPKDLGSDQIWHFDDQYARNILPMKLTLRTGDHLQTTCVFDSMGRDRPTIVGLETTDEMCWASFRGWPATTKAACKGEVWMGELGDEESGLGIAKRHPLSAAEMVWDGESDMSGGNMIKVPPPERNHMAGHCATNELMGSLCAIMGSQVKDVMTCDHAIPPDYPGLSDQMSFLVGASPLSMCCEPLCQGKCAEHPACDGHRTTTTTSTTISASASASGAMPIDEASRAESSVLSTVVISVGLAVLLPHM